MKCTSEIGGKRSIIYVNSMEIIKTPNFETKKNKLHRFVFLNFTDNQGLARVSNYNVMCIWEKRSIYVTRLSRPQP